MDDSKILDTKEPEITDIDFGTLTVAQIDYIEMSRQIKRLEEVGKDVKQAFGNFKNAVDLLTEKLKCSVSVDLSAISDRIDKIGLRFDDDGVLAQMQKQLNAYSELNDDIKNRFAELRALITSLYDEKGNWQYEDINLHGEGVNYNAVLKRNEFLKLVNLDESDLKLMLESSDDGSIKSTNIYKIIEQNYGLSDGKAALDYLISQIDNDSTLTPRGKSVKTALVLNNLCAQNEVRMPYVFTNMHENPTLDGVVKGADCSTYVSYLLKQGNENLDFGTTYTLESSKYTTLSDNYGELQSGDILMRNPGGERNAHVLFFVGYDKNGNLICAENTADSETGVHGTRLKAYTTDKLNSLGYKGYFVDYEAGESQKL